MFKDARRHCPEAYARPADPMNVQAAEVAYSPRPERFDVISTLVHPNAPLANAWMRNVSAEGCNLRVHGEHTLAADLPVVIRIGLWCMFGTVRWTNDDLVGIRFRQALGPENLTSLRRGCPGIVVKLHQADR